MESSIPIYHQIRRVIMHWILNKEYDPGDQIPSENELAEMFNVNRLTIRQGLLPLIQEGLLVRKRGEGTFVTTDAAVIHKFGLQPVGLIDDLVYTMSNSQTLKVRKEQIDATKYQREKLELMEGQKQICKFTRDRLVYGKYRAFTVNYLPLWIGERISEEDLYAMHLLQLLEQKLKIEFSQAFQTVEATYANDEIAEHLGVNKGESILLLERIVYSTKGVPVSLANTAYEGSSYKFSLFVEKIKYDGGSRWICQIK